MQNRQTKVFTGAGAPKPDEKQVCENARLRHLLTRKASGGDPEERLSFYEAQDSSEDECDAPVKLKIKFPEHKEEDSRGLSTAEKTKHVRTRSFGDQVKAGDFRFDEHQQRSRGDSSHRRGKENRRGTMRNGADSRGDRRDRETFRGGCRGGRGSFQGRDRGSGGMRGANRGRRGDPDRRPVHFSKTADRD